MMTPDFEDIANTTHSSVFSTFAYSLLEDILANADNPARMNVRLVELLRELTGARMVVLTRMQGVEGRHKLAAFEPQRRQPFAELPVMMTLANRTCDLAGPTLWEKGNGPPEADDLLSESLSGPLVAVPLRVGSLQVGALLLFGLPHQHSIDQITDLLGTLSRAVALVLRNAALFEDQEATIAARTRELAESKKYLEVTLRSIGDAVIATDIQGRVTLMNPVAETLTGWTEQEAVGEQLERVFEIINEESREEIENPVGRVLHEGIIVGLANHTLLISKDDQEIPIADSGAPIKDDDDEIIGVVLVFRDQTEERAAQNALRESTEEIRVRANQQAVVAELGRWALAGEDLSLLMDSAVTLVAETLQVEYARVLELQSDGNTFLLRAGVGWQEGLVGRATVNTGQESQAGYTLILNGPVTVEDLSAETRFSVPSLLIDHGVVSGISVIIQDGDRPFGVMGAHTTRHRSFSQDDVHFLQAIANVLAEAVRRKRTEEALREAEQRYRLLTEGGFEGIVISEKGVILDANPQFAQMFGYEESELVGKPVVELVVPEDRELVMSHIQAGYDQPYQHRALCRDGTTIIVEVRGQSMTFQGQPVRLTAIRNVTEQKQAEEALRESEEKYRALVENAGEVIIVAQDGRFKFVNRRITDLISYRPEELIEKPFIDYVHPEDRRMVAERYEKRMRGEELPPVYSFRAVDREGETKWVEINAVRIEWEGNPATLNFLTDITERKRLEEEQEKLQAQFLQAQKMESVGRLAGGVAHDLNNTLTAILGYAEIALDQLDPSHPLCHELNEIRDAGNRSANITQQLLAFARRQTIRPEVLNLNDCVTDLLRMLRRLIGEDIELIWMPGARLWSIQFDPGQVHQILVNLCVNARDAIPGVGCVTIETENVTIDEEYCKTYSYAKPGSYVVLAVSDDGCGMDEATMSQIFEPFFTTKEVGQGTGLGLSTVFGIVKQNQGFINVYSEPDEGSTFKIYLPRYLGPSEAESTADVESAMQGGSETILLVEDDTAILNLGQKMLEMLGYQVLVAARPSQAVILVNEHRGEIDLLITDVVMPEMNGRELSARIRELYPNLKVLFMSGYTSNVIAHRGVLEEEMSFIQKPFTMSTLAMRVRDVLER